MHRKARFWIPAIIVVAAAGYYFSNQQNLFSNKHHYYGHYSDVRGLQESSPVFLKGVKVGTVDEIDLNIKEKVRVVFAIDPDLQLRKGTKAIISAGDVNGSKTIRLEPGTGPFLKPGATLLASFDSTMAESFNARITPTIRTGKVLLHTADSALDQFNHLIRQSWGEETRQIFSGLHHALNKASSVSGTANQKVQQSQQIVNNLDNLTANPGEKISSVNRSLANAEGNTADAAKNNFKEDVRALGKSINELSSSFARAKQNKMLSDTQTYHSLSRALDTFNRDTRNYMQHPPPFINLGFGGKK